VIVFHLFSIRAFLHPHTLLYSVLSLWFCDPCSISNSLFEGNNSTFRGGVMNVPGQVNMAIYKTTFTFNRAEDCGGVFNFAAGFSSSLSLRNSYFINNWAWSGGIVCVTIDRSRDVPCAKPQNITLDSSNTFHKNSANEGGFIFYEERYRYVANPKPLTNCYTTFPMQFMLGHPFTAKWAPFQGGQPIRYLLTPGFSNATNYIPIQFHEGESTKTTVTVQAVDNWNQQVRPFVV